MSMQSGLTFVPAPIAFLKTTTPFLPVLPGTMPDVRPGIARSLWHNEENQLHLSETMSHDFTKEFAGMASMQPQCMWV